MKYKTDLIVLSADGWKDLVVFNKKYSIKEITDVVNKIKEKQDYDNEMIYKALEVMFDVKETICINNVTEIKY